MTLLVFWVFFNLWRKISAEAISLEMKRQSHYSNSQRDRLLDMETTLKSDLNHVGDITHLRTSFFTKILKLPSKPAVYQWLEFIAHLVGGSCCPRIYFTHTVVLKKMLRLKEDK